MLSAGIAALVCTAAPARAEIAAVWVIGDGEKIFADDLTTPPTNNLFFDAQARRVSLVASRNETVAFQVIVRGGAAETQATIRFDTLTGPATLANAADAELGGTLGHRIDLFREHYAQIRQRSRGIGWEPESGARPHGFTDNWVPDALIPIQSGKPFTVPARRNQAIWVDVYVPPETPPGRYQGPLEVAGSTYNVELEVVDLTLPPAPTQKTMVWFSGGESDLDVMAARYFADPGADPAAVERLRKRHFQLARRHRITLFLGQYPEPGVPALEQELTGKWFTRAEGYEGPGEGAPQDLCVLHAYGDGELTPESARAWTAWLDKIAPNIERIYYTVDEPSEEQFAEVNRRAAAGKPVPAFTTSVWEPRLEVNIYATLPIWYRDKDVAAARDKGRKLWLYNGMRPYSGSFLIDDVAVAPRVNGWIQFQRSVPRWFFWESTYYKDTQGKRGNIDVFKQPDNFSNRHDDLANGDGLLFYPGRDLIFPEHDQGIEYPLPSIRLKNWRRGLQDADYLALARERGLGEFVDDLLDAVLPYSLGDRLSRRDSVPFSESGEDWESARRLLISALRENRALPIPDALERHYLPFRMRFVLKWGLRGGAVLLFFLVLWVWVRRRRRR